MAPAHNFYMGTYNCQVVNCGAECKTLRGLAVHIAKKHPDFKPTTMGMITVVLSNIEKQKWEEIAKKNKTNLSEFVRFLVREELETLYVKIRAHRGCGG